MVDFKITQNDTYPALSGTCSDDGGSVPPLSGASVRFHMKKPGASGLKVDDEASILDETTGELAYQWKSGDTDESGKFRAEFEVTYSDGNVETFPSEPLEVYIRPELG